MCRDEAAVAVRQWMAMGRRAVHRGKVAGFGEREFDHGPELVLRRSPRTRDSADFNARP